MNFSYFSVLTCWDNGEANLYSFICNRQYSVISGSQQVASGSASHTRAAARAASATATG